MNEKGARTPIAGLPAEDGALDRALADVDAKLTTWLAAMSAALRAADATPEQPPAATTGDSPEQAPDCSAVGPPTDGTADVDAAAAEAPATPAATPPDTRPAETDPAQGQREEVERRDDEDVLAENALPELELDFTDEMTSERNQEYSREAESTENLLSSASHKGGISFNTYDWDFAPYMLAMKRAVERHLYPPYAFTHMGVVSGDNLIRFVVYPDGTIRDLRILDSDAHFSLDRASVRAIEAAAPFLPLPRNFPEEFLEVTAHFSYSIRR